jgi:hypothetical protein
MGGRRKLPEEVLMLLWLAPKKNPNQGPAPMLSDALPAKTHLTLPAEWRRRRLRFPAGVVPHFTDVPEVEWSWCGPVPVTTPARTVIDCAAASMVPDLVEQALREGLARGLFAIDDVGPAVRYIGAFR